MAIRQTGCCGRYRPSVRNSTLLHYPSQISRIQGHERLEWKRRQDVSLYSKDKQCEFERPRRPAIVVWGLVDVPRILCVDADPYLLDLLRYGFTREGFKIVTTDSGREALRLARSETFDMLILDVSLPDVDGLTVLATLRAFSAMPVVVLTALIEDEDVINGLEGGADDYVTKPFNMQTLIARVKAIIQRNALRPLAGPEREDERTYQVANAVLDTATYELAAPDGLTVRLTPMEGRILRLLVAHDGQALSADYILREVRHGAGDSDVNVIKTHIRHLRKKIMLLPGRPQPIRTLPGMGYVFDDAGSRGRVETQEIAACQEG